MSYVIVTHESNFPIQPKDIVIKDHLWDAFGNSESEVSAAYIVRLCQEHGSWRPFTEEEIEAFYAKCGLRDGFTFNRLIDGVYGPIVKKDGLYYVTHAFILRCFGSTYSTSVLKPTAEQPA